MGSLQSQKCVPCEGGIPPLSPKHAKQFLHQIAGWKLNNKNNRICHEIRFKDFKGAMKFVTRVAVIAEHEGHHPDFHVHYNRVILESWTHAIGGLSINDFILAAKINAIAPKK
ncbi:MAG: 4a-hydroxytetrahydrobiopterin dehydratase [Candidatus Diapherotrites archaeon]|nr:4a-hydroxytetrahydrobiopterin dehydratase [Candidatus Diapherotrites archaeon]